MKDRSAHIIEYYTSEYLCIFYCGKFINASQLPNVISTGDLFPGVCQKCAETVRLYEDDFTRTPDKSYPDLLKKHRNNIRGARFKYARYINRADIYFHLKLSVRKNGKYLP